MPKNPKILVIGAGISGLGAAQVLQGAGARVTVIESRDRIGGRVHTSHLWPDLPVDLGASWVHGIRRNPLVDMARDLGISTFPAPYDRWATYDGAGQRIDITAAEITAWGLIKKARSAARRAGPDQSLQTAIEGLPAWVALSASDRAVLRMIIATRIEHEYSGDWSRLSATGFDDDEDFVGGDILLSPGYGPIIADLARGLDLRLSQEVLAIGPDGQGVSVQTRKGRFDADHVIVTLPLGVLKSGRVRFETGLDPARQGAINRLEVGLLNKCWLRFDRVFWPETPDMINHLGTRSLLWAEWANGFRTTGQPLLVGFNAGAMAETVEKWDDATTVGSAMDSLRQMFGPGVPDPVGAQISRWRQDPFALGSYSFVAEGASSKDRLALARPDWGGLLWFAGEACSARQSASAHGALVSGRDAAKALLEHWDGRKPSLDRAGR